MSDVRSEGRARYIEPTLLFTSVTEDGRVVETTPPLEDYCIWAELICYSPAYLTKGYGPIKVTYINKNESTFVSFMNGSGQMYQRADGTHDNAYNYLSTDPYDFTTIQDLENGIKEGRITNECFGINSINIEYDSYQVPQVTIEFTDIRGVSLFGMEELSHPDPTSTEPRDNTSGSFFKCFFTFPYPRFYLQVKGFYGQPVSYDLTCYDFKAKFDYNTGNFGGTARFVGYSYGILNDIPLTFAVVAPSTERGKAYWESRVEDGAFRASNGMPLITFSECLQRILQGYDGMDEAAETAMSTRTEQSDVNNIDAIFEGIGALRNGLVEYLKSQGYKGSDNLNTAKEQDANTRYFMTVYDTNSPEKGFIIFLSHAYVNGKDKLVIDDSLKPLWDEIKGKVEKYPSIEMPLYPNTIYSGTASYEWLVSDEELKNKASLGADRIIFNFSTQGSALKSLRETKIEQLQSAVNQVNETRMARITNALGFFPSVKNITKILVAHMETLIKLMMDVETDVENMPESDRSVVINASSQAMRCGIGNIAFPTLTSAQTDGGNTRECECWMGALTNGNVQPEVKFIEEMIKGVENVTNDLQKVSQALESLTMIDGSGDLANLPTRYLVYGCDLFHNSDYWGNLDDDYGFADLVGRVMARIVLNSVTPFILGDDTDAYVKSGLLDALSFHKFHPFLSDDVEKQLKFQDSSSIDNLIKIIHGDDDTLKKYGKDGKTYPWTHDKITIPHRLLCFDNIKLFYEPTIPIIPMFDFDFEEFSELKHKFLVGQETSLPTERYSLIGVNTRNCNFVESPNAMRVYKNFSVSQFAPRVPQLSEENGIDQDVLKKYENISKEQLDSYTKFWENKRELFGQKLSVSKPDKLDSFYKNIFYKEKDGLPQDIQIEGNIDIPLPLPSQDKSSLRCYDDINNFTTYVFPSVSFVKKNTKTASIITDQETFDTVICKINQPHVFGRPKSITEVTKYDRLNVVERDGQNSFGIGSLFQSKLFYCSLVRNDKKKRLALVLTSYYHLLQKHKTYLEQVDGGDLESKAQIFDQCSYLIVLTKGMYMYFDNKENPNVNAYPTNERCYVQEFLDFAEGNVFNDFLNAYAFTDATLINIFLSNKSDKERWTKEAWQHLKTICDGPKTRPFLTISQYSHGPVFINNENNPALQAFFKAIFQPCLIVRGVTNKTRTVKTTPGISNFTISKSKVQLYTDSFFETLRKLYNIQTTTESSNSSSGLSAIEPTVYNDEVKLALYNSLQSLYKRWLMGGTMPSMEGGETNGARWREWSVDGALFNNWYFLDTYYTDIGDYAMLNLTTMLNLATNLLTNPQSVQLLSFISALYKEGNFALQCVQNFLKWSSSEVENNLNCIFKNVSYHDMDKAFHPSAIIAMWAQPSKHGADDKGSDYQDDGFYFDRGPLNLPTAINDTSGLIIPAFGVSVGKQYQHFFTDVSVSTDTPTMTDVSMTNLFAIATNKLATKKEEGNQTDNTLQVTFVGQDLFNIYANQSYSCQVSMMGCCWIQPLMYFQLNNVAMFKGAYMIQKVSHQISPGQSRTTFTGQRMCKYQPPFVKTPAMINGNYAYYGDNKVVDITTFADVDNHCPYKYFEPMPLKSSTPYTEEILNMPLGEYEKSCNGTFKATCKGNINIFDTVDIYTSKVGEPNNELKKHKQLNRETDTVMTLLGTIVATEFGCGTDLNKMLVLNQIFNKSISYGSLLFIAHGQNAVGEEGYNLYTSNTEHYNNLIRKVFVQSPLSLVGEQTYVNKTLTPPNSTMLKDGSESVSKTIDYLDVSTMDAYVTTQYYWKTTKTANGEIKHTDQWNKGAYVLRSDEQSHWGQVYSKGYGRNGTDPLWKEEDYQQVDADQEYNLEDLVNGIFNSVEQSLKHTNKMVGGKLSLTKNGSLGTITGSSTKLLIQVFDCLLSTYDKYLTSITWYCNANDGMGGNPTSVEYGCSLSTSITVNVGMKEETKADYYSFGSGDTINTKFLMSLKKHYGELTTENSNPFKQDCKNFGNIVTQSNWEVTVNQMMKGTINECSQVVSPNVNVNCDNSEESLDGTNFTMADLTRTNHKNVSNQPTAKDACNLCRLATQILHPIDMEMRANGMGPLKLNSVYRSAELNKVVGGSPTSQHSLGQAADITCTSKDFQIKLFKLIAKMIQDGKLTVGQLLEERRGDSSAWVHVSLPGGHTNDIAVFRNDSRKQTLTVENALKWNGTALA